MTLCEKKKTKRKKDQAKLVSSIGERKNLISHMLKNHTIIPLNYCLSQITTSPLFEKKKY